VPDQRLDHGAGRDVARRDDQLTPALARPQRVGLVAQQPLDVPRPVKRDRGGQPDLSTVLDQAARQLALASSAA
jgi:hypothetical protein